MAAHVQPGEAGPELLAYEAALPELLRHHAGEYVVIRNREVLNFFDSYTVALTWAYDKFGLDPFFVKRVDDAHSITHYTRDLGPWRK